MMGEQKPKKIYDCIKFNLHLGPLVSVTYNSVQHIFIK